MESNFIKERVVVREQLIKKNLEQDKHKETRNSSASASGSIETPSDRVIVFEELVNENLKQDLVDISRLVDQKCQIIADYLKIKSTIKILKKNPKNVRLQTNLGCNIYAQCQADDASMIYLCIGQDYFLLMGLDEALKMIDLKEKQLMKELDVLQEKASKIKAYIKIALETIGRLYEIDRDKLTESG